jgi:hypothetical protein
MCYRSPNKTILKWASMWIEGQFSVLSSQFAVPGTQYLVPSIQFGFAVALRRRS